MRIYYFGELIADTNTENTNNKRHETKDASQEAAAHQRVALKRTLIDVIVPRSESVAPRQLSIKRFSHA